MTGQPFDIVMMLPRRCRLRGWAEIDPGCLPEVTELSCQYLDCLADCADDIAEAVLTDIREQSEAEAEWAAERIHGGER